MQSFWERVREHKVIQWGIAYLGTALAVAHGAELVTHALHWPDAVWRLFVIALIVGLPIALTLAWYHGHKGLTQIGAGELSIIAVLVLIGAVFFTAALRPLAPHAADAAGAEPQARAPAAEPGTPAAVPVEPPTLGFLPNSVAVLPLENLSPNPDNAYVAAGLHEEILNQLSKLKNLNVIARTSVLQYGESRPSIPEIARALRVESVMEGSVRYAGNRIRVTTQLVDSETGSHLWSETYEREFDDIFAIESDIAMNVANALEAEFSVEEQRRIEQVPKVSPETYAAYLSALLVMGGAGNQSPQMLALLDGMIADAPEFAAPHGWKARIYANLLINTTFGSAGDPTEMASLARASAERALALDPNDHEANTALANIDLLGWHWPQARQTYERYYRATGRSPAYFDWFNSWSGRSAEAIEIARRDVDLDPFNAGAHWDVGIVSAYAKDYDVAAAALRRAIELAPVPPLFHTWLAFAEIGRGNSDAALRELELAERLLGDNRAIIYLVDILYSYGRIGRSADAARIFAEIQAIAASQEVGAGGWALAYLGIGDQERALEQLRVGAERARDKVLDQGFFSLMNIRMNVTADPVLEQPEFVAVRAQLTGD